MKALITLSFVFDLPADELPGIGEKMETSAIDSMTMFVENAGFSVGDIAELVEFYGCAVTVERELVS